MTTFRGAWRRVAFLASAAAAGIHLGAVRMHIDEYPPAGAFMLVTGAAQLAWALWVAAGAPRRVLLAGAIGNAGVVAVWFVSRTTGLPWGPEPWVAEHVHGNDAVATGLQLLVVMAAYALSARPMPPPEPIVLRLGTIGALAALVVTGDDPAREPLIATATIGFAFIARALVRAQTGAVLIRSDRRSHVQAPLVRSSRPALRAHPRAGFGAR